MGHFTEEALRKFQEMCAEGIDFGEGPTYDFAMCIKADGDIYGISPGEVCKEGKPVSDARAAKKEPKGGSRMAKLRAAFIKKTGRKMTAKELEKVRNMIRSLPGTESAGKEIKADLDKIAKKNPKD